MKHLPDWLAEAIFYQIYPQSFYDSNGDGIGDIPGIIEKLDYIESLGITAIWLNPCFVSPFMDAGYDISDFCKVAPRYGSNADLKRLFRQAHKRNIRVVLDLVPAHTSIEHPWFQKSSCADKNSFTNYYIWTDRAWTPQPDGATLIRGQYDRDAAYMPSFFANQPALNHGFAKPDKGSSWQLPCTHPSVTQVRKELMKIMRFWLDAGCDGFRVDMASTMIKNDPGWKETTRYWNSVSSVFAKDYPHAALIAEWSHPTAAIKAGFHMDFLIHMNDTVYNTLFRQESFRYLFENTSGYSYFDRQGKGDISQFIRSFMGHLKKIGNDGFICVPSGNHDLSRLRLKRTTAELEVIYAFLFTLPSVPLIYYGDEIGMRHISGLTSKEGGYCRTGARTPMQWSADKNLGFSTANAKKLYLPVDDSQNPPTVEDQIERESSLLNTVKKFINLRKNTEALKTYGNFEPVLADVNKYPFVYLRKKGRQRFLIALNPSGQSVKADLADIKMGDSVKRILGQSDLSINEKGRVKLLMKPVSYGIYEI